MAAVHLLSYVCLSVIVDQVSGWYFRLHVALIQSVLLRFIIKEILKNVQTYFYINIWPSLLTLN